MAAPSVIVIGGGVAGFTAAHELAERGFKVEVYETRKTWGGKARSQPVPGSGTNGRADLPGEHGFRFYPRFYKHVIDTMSRIPFGTGTVVDNLRATTESAIAMVDDVTWFRFYRRRVTKPYDVVEALELFFDECCFDAEDMGLFSAKVLQYLTTSFARRLAEYDLISWWSYLDGNRYSDNFQRQLRAVPRTMVAMDPKRGSARTVGTISMQLIQDFASTGVNNDRTMGGPTTEMWIEPWRAHLASLGVQLHAGQGIAKLNVSGGAIASVDLAGGGGTKSADFYVLAVPLDVAIAMITPEMGALDPVLEQMRHRDPDELVSWMVGIQYFLYEDVPLVRGHTFYPDSAWALTSISQPQFWRESGGLFRKRYGNGDVGGLISVDISDWNSPGRFIPKTAKQCTPDEIAKEVWEQLKAALNGKGPGELILTDDLLHSWHLDDDLDFSGGSPPVNHSRLLVHPPGSWALRPEAGTAIPNLVLASDYVRTSTDLASMEGANEAARHAVNAILQRSASTAARAPTWQLEEPESFDTWKRLDERLFHHGHRHVFELLGIERAAQAADLLRRFADATGISRVEDVIEQIRPSSIIKSLLGKLGLTVTN
jgi:15-cis-phytoene desaturase